LAIVRAAHFIGWMPILLPQVTVLKKKRKFFCTDALFCRWFTVDGDSLCCNVYIVYECYVLCKYYLLIQGDSSVRYLELTDKEPFLVESWFLF